MVSEEMHTKLSIAILLFLINAVEFFYNGFIPAHTKELTILALESWIVLEVLDLFSKSELAETVNKKIKKAMGKE